LVKKDAQYLVSKSLSFKRYKNQEAGKAMFKKKCETPKKRGKNEKLNSREVSLKAALERITAVWHKKKIDNQVL